MSPMYRQTVWSFVKEKHYLKYSTIGMWHWKGIPSIKIVMKIMESNTCTCSKTCHLLKKCKQFYHKKYSELMGIMSIFWMHYYFFLLTAFCSIGDVVHPLWLRIQEQARESYAMREVFSMDSSVRVQAIENLGTFPCWGLIDPLLFWIRHLLIRIIELNICLTYFSSKI